MLIRTPSTPIENNFVFKRKGDKSIGWGLHFLGIFQPFQELCLPLITKTMSLVLKGRSFPVAFNYTCMLRRADSR